MLGAIPAVRRATAFALNDDFCESKSQGPLQDDRPGRVRELVRQRVVAAAIVLEHSP